MPLFLGTPWWPIFIFPLCTALGLLFVWLWRGRDDHAALPMPHAWQPPLELSPAQVGTLVDASCDLRDIVATLVDLAARGCLSIEEVQSGDVLLRRGDLRFVRGENGPPVERLKRHERLFLEALFDPQPPDIELGKRAANTNLKDEPWNETALSLLKNKFYRHLPPIRQEIYDSLMREGFFFADPAVTRGFFGTVGLVLVIAGWFVASHTGEDLWASGFASVPLGVLLSGFVWMIGARFMPAKTALGTRKADQAKHFVAWVRSVPVPSLRAMLDKDARLFERLLPYALVLGVGEVWAQKCGECGVWTPFWFGRTSSMFEDAPQFVAGLLADLTTIERVFASSPPSRPHSKEEVQHNF